MQRMFMMSKVLAAVAVLSVLIQHCGCEPVQEVEEQKRQQAVAELVVEPKIRSADDLAVTSALDHSARSAVDTDYETHIDTSGSDSEARKHKIKIKVKKPKLKKAKKFLKKILPFLLIPLIIQAKLIPLFLFKLKLIALKAFGVGKLALLLVLFNLVYMTLHGGAHDSEQQYTKEVIANEHYGYNGGSEVGAWINRRYFNAQNP